MAKRKKSSGVGIKKILIIAIFLFLAISGLLAFDFYRKIFSPNVKISDKESAYLYVKIGSTLSDVTNELFSRGYIKNASSFEWVANRKNYFKPEQIKPGKYKIKSGMSNNDLVNLLRSGNQVPVRINLSNVRTVYQIAGLASKNLELDSLKLLELMRNSEYLSKQFGLNKRTVFSLFIPDTYEFFWNTDEQTFLNKMAVYYKEFWTDERIQKAESIGFSQFEVAILASIVQSEQSRKKDERPIIAGLYINRLKKEMKLESDPTVIYAIGDFSIKRVIGKDLKTDSPFNTYRNYGLPPAPIILAEKDAMDAVLNHQKHNYIFMCAKEDLSGYHYFAENYLQHKIYAARYRNALNKRGIIR